VIDKRKIELEHPIKTIGEHTVPVQVYHEVTAQVRITVAAE
jgi:large subunit ribosomal protein L9